MPSERFDCILDPMDLWTVWDHELGSPALIGEDVLYGLSEREAKEAAHQLNRLTTAQAALVVTILTEARSQTPASSQDRCSTLPPSDR